ncbi:MAG: hypothetical protein VB140_04330 [Burkholderia sp.]|nr:MAG: hypothetical protein E5299_00591 [Burkholderia gladioli]
MQKRHLNLLCGHFTLETGSPQEKEMAIHQSMPEAICGCKKPALGRLSGDTGTSILAAVLGKLDSSTQANE